MEVKEHGIGGELTKEASEVLKIFQQFKVSSETNKQIELAEKFSESLLDLVDPKHLGEHNKAPRGQKLVKLLTDGILDGINNHTLYFSTGTSGNRIFFSDHLTNPNESLKDIESIDGKIGFMFCPKPDSNIGLEEYNNFVKHFGSSQVDLMRKLE